jgi:hypothetical protein
MLIDQRSSPLCLTPPNQSDRGFWVELDLKENLVFISLVHRVTSFHAKVKIDLRDDILSNGFTFVFSVKSLMGK